MPEIDFRYNLYEFILQTFFQNINFLQNMYFIAILTNYINLTRISPAK